MKKLFLLPVLSLFIFATAAQAQVPSVAKQSGQVATRTERGLLTSRKIAPPMPGSMVHDPFTPVKIEPIEAKIPNIEIPTVQVPTVQPQVAAATPAQSTKTRVNSRSLWEQMKRNYQARKLKKIHAQSVALAQAKAKLPQPVESEAFFTTTLLPFSPDRDARMTPLEFPFMEEPDVLYRGLALDNEGKSIANILENGLRTQDAGEESTTLLVAYASHSQNPNFLADVATRKVTNLTSSPTNARYWIGKRISTELPVPVITRVTDVGSGNWVTLHEDIPASQITVFAILKINNQARWCSIERATDAAGQVGFKITPFEYRLRHE